MSIEPIFGQFNLRDLIYAKLWKRICAMQNSAPDGHIPLPFQRFRRLNSIIQLSIDSEAGTTKFMRKFVHQHGGKSTSDVILLGEAHGISESFTNLSALFGPAKEEIRDLLECGVDIDGDKFKVKISFVGDLKIYYGLLRMSTAGSKHPCPWCRMPLDMMDECSE